MAIIKLAIKGGLVYYAVKTTKDYGVWGNSDNAVELKGKLCETITPIIQTGKAHAGITYEFPELPSKGTIGYLTKYYYNAGVKNTIYFIHRFPCFVGMGVKKASETINQAIDSFAQSPEPAKPLAKN